MTPLLLVSACALLNTVTLLAKTHPSNTYCNIKHEWANNDESTLFFCPCLSFLKATHSADTISKLMACAKLLYSFGRWVGRLGRWQSLPWTQCSPTQLDHAEERVWRLASSVLLKRNAPAGVCRAFPKGYISRPYIIDCLSWHGNESGWKPNEVADTKQGITVEVNQEVESTGMSRDRTECSSMTQLYWLYPHHAPCCATSDVDVTHAKWENPQYLCGGTYGHTLLSYPHYNNKEWHHRNPSGFGICIRACRFG